MAMAHSKHVLGPLRPLHRLGQIIHLLIRLARTHRHGLANHVGELARQVRPRRHHRARQAAEAQQRPHDAVARLPDVVVLVRVEFVGLVLAVGPLGEADLEAPEPDGGQHADGVPPAGLGARAEGERDALVEVQGEAAELGGVGGADAPQPPAGDGAGVEVEQVPAVEDRGRFGEEGPVAGQGGEEVRVVFLVLRFGEGDLEGELRVEGSDVRVADEQVPQDLLARVEGEAGVVEGCEGSGGGWGVFVVAVVRVGGFAGGGVVGGC